MKIKLPPQLHKIIHCEAPSADGAPLLWSAWVAPAAIVAGVALSALPALLLPHGQLVALSLLSYMLEAVCFFLLPLIVAARYGREPESLGMRRVSLSRAVPLAVSAGVSFYLLNVAVSLLIGVIFPQSVGHTQDVVTLLAGASAVDTALLVVTMTVIAPLAEETVFRACFLPPLTVRFGRRVAIIISAVVFAAMHLDIWVFPPLLAGGLCFGWLYDKYHNLWINAGAHAVWNGIALALYFLVA